LADNLFKTELHVHTSPCSICAEVPPETAVEDYARLGTSAIVITNHINPNAYNYESAEAYAESYLADYRLAKATGERLGVNVILGAEIRFTENSNDYLVYGISEDDILKMYPLIDKGIENFYKEFKNDRNLILQAHPFRNGMVLAPVDSIDGIETFNSHPGHNSRIAVALKYASENPRFITVGGTDYHHKNQEGLTFLLTNRLPKDSFDLAEILKSRNYAFWLSGAVAIPLNNTWGGQ